MRYTPWPSETTDFTFSINASLAASTVTPGSTAPDVSVTVPVIALCARATAGMNARHPSAMAATNKTFRVIRCLLQTTPNHLRRLRLQFERKEEGKFRKPDRKEADGGC